jgi:hypothetical protein
MTAVRYFIRVPSEQDSVLGPLTPTEALEKAGKLREKGIHFFITSERGVVLQDEEAIKRCLRD